MLDKLAAQSLFRRALVLSARDATMLRTIAPRICLFRGWIQLRLQDGPMRLNAGKLAGQHAPAEGDVGFSRSHVWNLSFRLF